LSGWAERAEHFEEEAAEGAPLFDGGAITHQIEQFEERCGLRIGAVAVLFFEQVETGGAEAVALKDLADQIEPIRSEVSTGDRSVRLDLFDQLFDWITQTNFPVGSRIIG